MRHAGKVLLMALALAGAALPDALDPERIPG